MTPALVLAADAAYPFSLRLLPSGCDVVIGYLGERTFTPHVWKPNEIAAVRNSGRQWWGVWTPPQDQVTAAGAALAASGAINAAQIAGMRKTDPIFLDIERGTFDTHRTSVAPFVGLWKQTMRARGWVNVFAYVPAAADFDWCAHWTGIRPTSLPAAWVGQQYANAVAAGAYDLSVFDPVKLGIATASPSNAGTEQRSMFIVVDKTTTPNREYLQTDDGALHHLAAGTTVAAYMDAKVPVIELDTEADVATFLAITPKV